MEIVGFVFINICYLFKAAKPPRRPAWEKSLAAQRGNGDRKAAGHKQLQQFVIMGGIDRTFFFFSTTRSLSKPQWRQRTKEINAVVIDTDKEKLQSTNNLSDWQE